MTDDREDILRRDGIVIGIAGMSLLNGMHFSAYFDPVFILMKQFAPGFFISSPLLIFYFTSLFISALTLAIGGIPAAIYERGKGLETSNATSMWIWLGGIMLLTIPTLLQMTARPA
ncbi:hypothetical protein [Bosea sp. (in: a-proteobacteria)]|uniref:hypothetical protein n=1 Tax=Bosea sp. (in: a-proteobacteria) TaxID=1871050 RepID=UPI0027375131|nr:hypothetical protein [Bosea sp. (in: a-proteobacteria)]MDP3408600.1 hypothetical protein [Bosea sp. (in: a-proteobacteria)]